MPFRPKWPPLQQDDSPLCDTGSRLAVRPSPAGALARSAGQDWRRFWAVISEESRLLAKQIAADRPFRKSILRVRAKSDDSISRVVSTVLKPPMDRRIPEPGASLVKTYKGKTIRVVVRRSGFEFNGAQYKSLTAIARIVTGQRSINGFQFFNLGKRRTGQ